MRRLAVAAVAVMTVALAHRERTRGVAAAAQHFGPYASNSPDEGTCGNTWANDTFDRLYTVKTKPKNGRDVQRRRAVQERHVHDARGAEPGCVWTRTLAGR